MRKSQIFKYILPVSIILFYVVTVKRMSLWDMGLGEKLEFPVYGFPLIFHDGNPYEFHPTGLLPLFFNLTFYFIFTFLVFFVARKLIHIKESNWLPLLLWIICIPRLSSTALLLYNFGWNGWGLLHAPITPGIWELSFFNMQF